ncbi:pirin family protein [Sulfurimicrobium lacus]|uniref:Pirin family protein n=1 Tax=Sulfurimicrobium lacus TaxID=2715678 RepID=A0A6F8VD29_9PROT|nr:pirin family protein [Sulfurimicrobium lacus]BCB27628.1 pirin family protein [Sulfurimicrobium lacus]
MIQLRKASERGHANHGWLDTWHSFSFADYYDPQHMGFSVLRVINDDRIAPGAGFPTHSHRDMEIITYLLQGSLAHKDSMGNGSVIRPGEIQRMSAGSGISHSEFNASESEEAHLLQIWIEPKENGITPSYEQKSLPVAGNNAQLNLLASPDGQDGSVIIHQDVRLYATHLQEHGEVAYSLPAGRRAYLHLARGKLKLNGLELEAGDGAKILDENINILSTEAGSEALLFDLP